MKKLILPFLTILSIILACSSNEEEFAEDTKVTINFTHTWDGTAITSDDVESTEFVNENGETLTIQYLRYLISDIYLENENGIVTELTDYLLVNLGEEKNLTFSTEKLLLNDTYNVYCRFGFNDDDNYVEDGYTDLNSESFGVPTMLGGGYHYMQFDGKYINDSNIETGFNYHAIRATNSMSKTEEEELLETDTSFQIDLGEIDIKNNTVTIDIEMDVAEWFVNPNTWNLNDNFINLMMDYDAQIMISENGESVFSLVEEDED